MSITQYYSPPSMLSETLATAAVVAAITYIRTTLKHRQQEKYKAEELVQVVLKRLQDQVSRLPRLVLGYKQLTEL